MDKLIVKRKCKCGRFILVQNTEFGIPPQPVCATCKTYGLEQSIVLKEKYREEVK